MTHCEYCKRQYANPPETCAGCWAWLSVRAIDSQAEDWQRRLNEVLNIQLDTMTTRNALGLGNSALGRW